MTFSLPRLRFHTPGRTYWDDQVRRLDGQRLSWFGEGEGDDFWGEFWSQRINPSYFEAARRFDLERDELGRELQRELDPGGRHLEAGCGGGFWVAALVSRGFHVEGLELSGPLVERIHAVEPTLPVRQGDALAIDAPDNSYDSYLSFGVIEHRRAGPEPFLREAIRVLRPGGKLILTVPYFGPVRQLKARLHRYQETPPEIPFFQYAFSRAELVSLCEKAGFQIVRTRPMGAMRMLDEEVPWLRWLSAQRGGGLLRRNAPKILDGLDGHTILVVGVKPERG